MLRDKQQARRVPSPAVWARRKSATERFDLRVPVLVELLDSLDLRTFFFDPACRRRLNDVLDTFSDEEFDSFERHYTRRQKIN